MCQNLFIKKGNKTQMTYFLQALFFLIISNSYASSIDLSRFQSELNTLNKVQEKLWNHGISKELASQDQKIDDLIEDTISTRHAGVQKTELPKIENSLDKIKKKKFDYKRLRNRSR